MQIDATKYRLDRDPETIQYSDIVTSGAVKTGPAVWNEGEQDQLTIPFSPEPTAAEQWAITRRLFTLDAVEEQLYASSESAQTANTNWRTNTSPQITTGAQAIENTTGTFASNTVRDGHIRTLAQGVRLVNVQLSAVSNQLNQVIDMLQTQLERN